MLVINHSLWQRRFGGKQEVIGQKVLLDDEQYTLVGVMPPHFFLEDREAYFPFEFNLNDSRRLYVVARLKYGVSLEQANAELEVMARNQENVYGSNYQVLIGRTVYTTIDQRGLIWSDQSGFNYITQRSRTGTASCLREYRESLAGASDGAHARDGSSRHFGRRPYTA